MELRSALSPGAVGVIVDDLMTAITTMIYTWTIDSVEFAASGSNIFNPVTSGIEGNSYGSGAGSQIAAGAYYNFIARSSGGRRLRMAVFGANVLGDDYRFVAGESADLTAGRDLLVAAGSGLMCIDGLTPVWKSYINAGFNAYWQRAVRP
jgi:hypothetical protein